MRCSTPHRMGDLHGPFRDKTDLEIRLRQGAIRAEDIGALSSARDAMTLDLMEEARPQLAALREPAGAIGFGPRCEGAAIPRRALFAFVGLQVGEPDQGRGGVGFVLELAELFAVGFEPAVEGEAERAFDAGEVAAAVGDLGVTGGDGPGAPAPTGGRGIVGAGREGGCGKGAAVAADEVGDGLFGAAGETIGHEPSIGSGSGFCKSNPDENPE